MPRRVSHDLKPYGLARLPPAIGPHSVGGLRPSDPIAERTFRSAVLDWNALDRSPHKERHALVRLLLTLRRRHVAPRLADLRRNQAQAEWRGGVLSAHWHLGDGSRLALVANLTAHPRRRPTDAAHGEPIWGGAPPPDLPPWSVFWSIG